jgi:hypothetical protein
LVEIKKRLNYKAMNYKAAIFLAFSELRAAGSALGRPACDPVVIIAAYGFAAITATSDPVVITATSDPVVIIATSDPVVIIATHL